LYNFEKRSYKPETAMVKAMVLGSVLVTTLDLASDSVLESGLELALVSGLAKVMRLEMLPVLELDLV
jgi:hypothetical protein